MAKLDQVAFAKWVEAHTKDSMCPGCGTQTKWVYGSFVGGIVDVGEGKADLGHGYEVAPVYCKSCGFIRLYAIEPFVEAASVPKQNGGITH